MGFSSLGPQHGSGKARRIRVLTGGRLVELKLRMLNRLPHPPLPQLYVLDAFNGAVLRKWVERKGVRGCCLSPAGDPVAQGKHWHGDGAWGWCMAQVCAALLASRTPHPHAPVPCHRFSNGQQEGAAAMEACFSPDNQYVLSGQKIGVFKVAKYLGGRRSDCQNEAVPEQHKQSLTTMRLLLHASSSCLHCVSPQAATTTQSGCGTSSQGRRWLPGWAMQGPRPASNLHHAA